MLKHILMTSNLSSVPVMSESRQTGGLEGFRLERTLRKKLIRESARSEFRNWRCGALGAPLTISSGRLILPHFEITLAVNELAL